MADEKIGEEKELQRLLTLAQKALDEVKKYAKKHDLEFHFAGLRRGPAADEYGPVDRDELEEGDERETTVDVLDWSSDWNGSWSPGC